MPTYDYVCESCGREFIVTETLAEHEKPHYCPTCGSKNVRQVPSGFAAKTDRKA